MKLCPEVLKIQRQRYVLSCSAPFRAPCSHHRTPCTTSQVFPSAPPYKAQRYPLGRVATDLCKPQTIEILIDDNSPARTPSSPSWSLSFPVFFSMRSRVLFNSSATRVTSCASTPVTATMRRIPFVIPDSSVITKSLIRPVRATWLK